MCHALGIRDEVFGTKMGSLICCKNVCVFVCVCVCGGGGGGGK